jgi:hypothetical protein
MEPRLEAKVGDAITAKLGDTYFDDVDTTLPVAQLYAYADFTLVKSAFELIGVTSVSAKRPTVFIGGSGRWLKTT